MIGHLKKTSTKGFSLPVHYHMQTLFQGGVVDLRSTWVQGYFVDRQANFRMWGVNRPMAAPWYKTEGFFVWLTEVAGCPTPNALQPKLRLPRGTTKAQLTVGSRALASGS